MILIVCVLSFQNRDMEPQYHCVVDFRWRVAGFSCIEHTGYVLLPHLFSLSSHIALVKT
jgi:hypothetical protein